MEETKKCPYCGGTVLAVAKKCKHCKQWIENVEMETCPICGEEVIKGTEVCPYCKENIKNFRWATANLTPCPICQELIPSGMSFCPYCNENIDLGNDSQSSSHEEHQTQHTNSDTENPFVKDKLLYIFAAILLLIFITCVLVFAINKPKEMKSEETVISGILKTWSRCHNSHNLRDLNVTYAPYVKYYQSDYTRDEVIASKERLFKKDDDFHQEVDNIVISFPATDTALVVFDKYVNYDQIYPSYLRFCKDGYGWYIIEESDSITDANLKKRSR